MRKALKNGQRTIKKTKENTEKNKNTAILTRGQRAAEYNDEYNLWNAIKMVVADTTTVNREEKEWSCGQIATNVLREGCHQTTIYKLSASFSGQDSPCGDRQRT